MHGSQFGGAMPLDQLTKHPAPGDRLKLPVIAGQDQFRACALGRLQQPGHDRVIDHRRLVHHHHGLGIPAGLAALQLPQLAVQRGGMAVAILA